MPVLQKDICFCTFALGKPYQVMAKKLADDFVTFGRDITLLVGTDNPRTFDTYSNIWAYKHEQVSALHCYNDRRFLLEKAFTKFSTAITIDADTKLTGPLPTSFSFQPGIDAGSENLIEHMTKYRPEDLHIIEKAAIKLNVPITKALWIVESLLIVTADEGKEKEFIRVWGNLASFVEINGMHSGDGNLMGLAALKAQIGVQCSDNWRKIDQIRQHLDASGERKEKTAWQKLQRRFQYHYRLNKTRLLALRNFDFYYR